MSRAKEKPVYNRSQSENIEVLQQKQNGSAIEPDQESTSSKASKASIKGMWKKAFKSLKTTKEPKEKESKEKAAASKERLDSENEKMEHEKPKYSRMSSRQSSMTKKGLFRKESKESPTTEEPPPPVDLDSADSVFRELRLASIRKRQLSRAETVDASFGGSSNGAPRRETEDFY